MKLDNRLKCIADFVDDCNSLWDVGSDHGYLPIYLLKENKIKNAIISDINKGPIENAKENAKKYALSKKMTFIKCDGLNTSLSLNYDAISVCGMGGELICEVLRKDINKARSAKYLILQPMSAQEDVRRFLYENDFTIINEKITKDRHLFYNIIKCIPKRDNFKYSDIFFEIGYIPFKEKDPLFKEFLLKKILKEKEIISNLEGKLTQNAKEKLQSSIKRLNKLNGVKRI